MMYGYTGKILKLNLTTQEIGAIDTEQYAAWGGGHGMGSAIFWDLCRDKKVGGFDPGNVVTIMSSPLAGTLSPASSRCEVQGIGPQGYPVEWFTWSSFGGRFAAQLKYAGWDGIVIGGRSQAPVWVNIVNDRVTFENAGDLWGKDTKETQRAIWGRVSGERFNEWHELEDGYTTQRAAVLCIGQAGERLSRIAALIHDGANAAGQGGFGGVFGAKNLKAISVLGTGGVPIANPRALVQSWRWYRTNFQYNVDAPILESPKANSPGFFIVNSAPGGNVVLKAVEPCRPHACQACPLACSRRTFGGIGDESCCMPTIWPFYTLHSAGGPEDAAGGASEAEVKALRALKLSRARYRVADMLQYYGINAYELCFADVYLLALYNAGVLGRDRPIPCHLPFERWDSEEFKQGLMRMIAERQGIGDDLAEGVTRAALKWGRYEEDSKSGLLLNSYWGYFEHYEPRVEVEWSYSSILSSRDTNDHGFNIPLYTIPRVAREAKVEPVLSAQQTVEILSQKVPPYIGDPFMFDYGQGPTGIYSQNKAKTIAWSRRYTLFWKDSLGYCDLVWPSFVNVNAPGMLGATPEGEPRFLNAVTGQDVSFSDGIEIGRRIWNLDRAIWVLQGRHRDMEVFPGYVYDVPVTRPHPLPVYENGEWRFSDNLGRTLDKARFEGWKTLYFKFEGWDTRSGWPTRHTLEELGLPHVANALESQDRLGENE
jgi:aldehyde:ferredoxin oxidoreductase